MATDEKEEGGGGTIAIDSTRDYDDGNHDGTDATIQNFRDGLMGRILACCGVIKTTCSSGTLLPDQPNQDEEEEDLTSCLPGETGDQAEDEVTSPPNRGEYQQSSSVNYEAAVFQLLRGASKPCRTYTRLRHHRQQDTWDCGIACLLMVLDWLRGGCNASALLQSMERNLLLEKVSTQSIWTVDLVILLEHLLEENNKNNNNRQNNKNQPNHSNTSYLFVSQVVGVNAEHSQTGYYEKAFIDDSTRINQLCVEMNRLRIPVLWPYRMEFHQQFIDLISNDHCIAILLVDNSILTTPRQTASNDSHNNNSKRHDTYMGHYIVVCGISREPDHLVQAVAYDDGTASTVEGNFDDNATEKMDFGDKYCIVVANPGISESILYVTPEKLERAWRADGTDCDVIFVAKHPSSSS